MKKLAYNNRRKSILFALLVLAFVITLTPIFPQPLEDKAEEVRSILKQHEVELLGIPGVRNVAILWKRGEYVFNVMADEGTDQTRIPVSLDGVPVMVTSSTKEQTEDKAYETVKAIKTRREDELFKNPGVVAVGIGEADGEYVLRVFVEKEDDLQYLPTEINEVKVVPFVSGRFEAYDTCTPFPDPCTHRGAFSPPVPMGVSTWSNQACAASTLGFKACDTGNPTIVGYVTANHVAASGPDGCPNIPFSVPEFQPGPIDFPGPFGCKLATPVGNLDSYVIISAIADNLVDAAFVRSNDQTVSANILDIGFPTPTPVPPFAGQFVQKSGRGSGYTSAIVKATATTALVDYGCFVARFVGQIMIQHPLGFRIINPGDSGALWVDASNNPVGLLFAGNPFGTVAFANVVDDVLRSLFLRICF